MLDDRRHLAVGVADDAAVTGGIVELDRQQRQRARARVADDRFERLGARQRVGAEQDERHAVGAELRQRLGERVARAQRRILQCPMEIGVGKARAHRVAAMAVDDANAIGGELARGLDHMREQRPPAQRMQNFRQPGAHSLADAGSEDRDVEGRRPGGRHGVREFYANPWRRPNARGRRTSVEAAISRR